MTDPTPPVPPVEPGPVTPPPVDPYAQVTPPPAAPYAPAGYGQPGQNQPGYAPAGYPQAYQPGYYAPPPKGLAIASMVTGIAGAFFSLFYGFGFLPAVAAVITGHLARKRQPYARGMWLTGLICGYVGIGLSLLWLVGIVLFFVFFASHPGSFDSGNYGSDY